MLAQHGKDPPVTLRLLGPLRAEMTQLRYKGDTGQRDLEQCEATQPGEAGPARVLPEICFET